MNTTSIAANQACIAIRAMEMKDVEQVLQIDRLSFAMPWSENAYRYELTQNGRSQLWVAETCSENGPAIIVGMVVVWLILGEAHIATIAVHPEYRGQAIGKQLVAKALTEAIRQGCIEATLEVRAGNLAAQNLYRQFGFEVVGRRPRYYHNNQEDALIMTVKGLGPAYLDWLESGKWKKTPAQT